MKPFKAPATLLTLFLLLPAVAWSVTLSGYVRSVNTSGSCSVGGFPVNFTHLTSLNISHRGTSLTYLPHLPLTELRRGEFVTFTGKRDKKTGILQADSLAITQPTAKKQISGTATIDRLPQLQPQNSAYTGTLCAGGYILHITPATKVTLPPGDSLTAPNWITYTATLQKNGSYLASQITFTPDQPGPKDTKYKKKTDHHFRPGKCPTGALNVVRLFRTCFATVPDAQIQNYVATIGNSLIPEWQRSLPATDPAKIHFHFYVIERNRHFSTTISDDAGTVIIPSNVLVKLQNKAQLAALLSADVSGAINQGMFRTRIGRRTANGAILASEVAVNYLIPFGGLIPALAGGRAYNQAAYIPQMETAYRIGLRYLADAHYDIYQAPIALMRISQRHPNKTRSIIEPQVGRYIESQLALFYPNYNSAQAETGAHSYAAFLTHLRQSDPKLRGK